jgi:hypothetical protein
MKLQINAAGAWRNVLDYPRDRDAEVRWHAAYLANIVGAKLRVLHDDGKPAASWTRETGWKEWLRR